MSIRPTLLVLVLGLSAATLVGCEDDSAERKLDRAGDKVERAADKVGDATSDAANKVGDKVEDAGDRAKRAAD